MAQGLQKFLKTIALNNLGFIKSFYLEKEIFMNPVLKFVELAPAKTILKNFPDKLEHSNRSRLSVL